MDHKALTEQLTSRLNVPREDVGILLHALAETIESAALEKDTITIPGFGAFETRLREERAAVHPSTGKKMLYPPKLTLIFKPSSMLRNLIKSPLEKDAK